MGLTRKSLSAMEIDADKIDRIIELHTGVTNALNEQLDAANATVEKYKAEAAKLKEVQKELDDLKAQVEADAKEREGKDYDKLKQEFEDYKAEQEKKAANEEKKGLFTELLKDMNVSENGIAQILKWQGVDGVEVEDGKIANAKDLRKSVKEDWGDYITTTETKGADVAQPPANTGGTGKTREEIFAIKDYSKRQEAIAQNHELFGF